jgi:hypothetical protein
MKIKTIAINSAAKLLLDKQLWSDVKMFVNDMESRDLPNHEKHQKVMDDIKFLFGDISNFIINLAISLAVAWLKTLSETTPK